MKRTLFVGIFCLLSLCARAGVLEDIVPRPAQAELHKGSLRVSGIAVKCDPAFGQDARDAVAFGLGISKKAGPIAILLGAGVLGLLIF